ncbi:hypothetical protein [Halorubrum ezzemoulense]|uniref:GIY-YIG domain-containing protein n=1 Tax=Halorubrum ezzemoulense TaxID=337243 RepID=A0A256JS09_HALEZ|nr:hypothetical protein [Halorubrum ezzemoulense]MDB2240470.1 hypothetical protein [Halorubrum ezzemoulense]MDB2271728.1 hypothetical protein [Halorubrum ezzemoulense]MDB9233328.1 hypothetical protein [Halorubrum ezzemoulense]OYR71679.1 hypothetical protein DJ76_13865 [Halorubrum ezzemoulense]
MTRRADLDRFYDLLDDLARRVGGPRKLKECTGYMDWPDRGVYFFLAPGETRASTDQSRVTRVGTHAVSAGSSTTLWDRLKQHYGTGSGSSNHPHGGAHRASVYRKRVGEAIIEKYGLREDYPDWDERWSGVDRERAAVRDEEYALERRVSAFVREQPFLWVPLDDEPGADSDRRVLERNSIALLSNFDREPVDPRRTDWIGRHSRSRAIRESGLWNVDHADEQYDGGFLGLFADAVDDATPP